MKIKAQQKKGCYWNDWFYIEENLIKKFSKKMSILKAGNMSLGVNLLIYLTEITSKSLGNNFLSVYEVHHKHKKIIHPVKANVR